MALKPIEIRRGNSVVLIGRAGSFPAAMVRASDSQRRDSFVAGLPQERVALQQIRSEWTTVFPATAPELLAGPELVRTLQRGIKGGMVEVIVLRMPRMPVMPADIEQLATGVINVGTAQRRLLIARSGGLPPELRLFRDPGQAMQVLEQLTDGTETARQIDQQAGRLSANGRAALSGRALRQNLAWQIRAGSLDAAVIAHGPAVAAAAARPDAPRPVMAMSTNERIGEALKRSVPYAVKAGGDAIRQQIEDMVQPESLAMMIGMVAVVAVANLNPVSGAAVDTTLLLMAWWNGGKEAIDGVADFAMATLDARNATTERELEAAAEAYGKALGLMGPKLLSAIVDRFLKRRGGKGEAGQRPGTTRSSSASSPSSPNPGPARRPAPPIAPKQPPEPPKKTAVIGRMDDLKAPGAIRPNEYTIAEKLPNLGDPKANYRQNMSVLRDEMRRKMPIRDASAMKPDSFPAPTADNPLRTVRQTFTGAERNQLMNRGWTFDGEYWNPPK